MATSVPSVLLLPVPTCTDMLVSPVEGGDLLHCKPHFDHHPNVWGDYFLTFSPCTPSMLLNMKRKAHVSEEQVRRMILECSSGPNLHVKLELIDTLERLCIDYHYEKEIENVLRRVHEEEDDTDNHYDLHTTALRFYLLRKHGYYASPDVFQRFRDEEGNFTCDDNNNGTRSMLSLYNAAHLRIHGEEILDDAIVFTRNYLQSVVKHLQSPMADEVCSALRTPLFRRPRRVEARHYISVYDKLPTRNETILEFAKLDFGILQSLYCEELNILTMWWKELQLQDHLSFARDRMVEMHFWMLGVLFEPQYSYGRTMLTKLFIFVSIFDDIYDNYSTLEESKLFTEAIERWDEEAAEELPGYMKFFYKKVLTTMKSIETDLKLQGNKHVDYVKNLLIDATRCYYNEVKWRSEGADQAAATVEEHLKISVPSSCCMHVPVYAFVAMGNDVTTDDAINWGMAYPKIITSSCIVGRLVNDIASHEREQGSSSSSSTVEACMREHGGITKEEAYAKLRELVEESWMDIAGECLRPAAAQPPPLLEAVVNATRVLDFLYKDDQDAYTHPSSLKDTIHSIYILSV
ncbi:(E)-beta-caryophyllene synthase-like [Oryza glaberrima]|uniref:Terpene synthase n=2 Tax=Oryza TaxID=4527 RepID=A0A076KZH5_9ORYZ|nr:(E)-beta-caryophyllene synthase-like [Oryza glaberrima]AIJ00878.1 terpene synthase [Oryza barthii]